MNESSFVHRHIPAARGEDKVLLEDLGYSTLEALVADVVPAGILHKSPLRLPRGASESEALSELKGIAALNQVHRSYIGMGYADCLTPTVIQRNILENPGWYTAYTPYQAEIAQGRLEALLNFQTMVTDLTGMEFANASLLDEASAAGEAMALLHSVKEKANGNRFLVSRSCHPQVIAVVKTRAEAIGAEIEIADITAAHFTNASFGMLLAYPGTDGRLEDLKPLIDAGSKKGVKTVVCTDLLSLTLLQSPGEMGADVVVGNSQRFGVPLGFGGPHAAFFATRKELVRNMPGRLVGVSKDREGRPAFRLTLQTREQHIRREKATSNVCTAQVLLAVIASMYAVYHGPEGLKEIAKRVHGLTSLLAAGLRRLGLKLPDAAFFDTLKVTTLHASEVLKAAREHKLNLRAWADGALGVALDETTTETDVLALLTVFNQGDAPEFTVESLRAEAKSVLPTHLTRKSPFLTAPVFHRHHSETEMLRYLRTLESRDLSLTHSMIPLGSCTMKLNATSELMPITWPNFNRLHPFAPSEQTKGYYKLVHDLESWLGEITGMEGVSLQPNSGAQGEYAGLLVIKKFHEARGEEGRTICLIPRSAHGTNPASAVMAGFKVVVVECDSEGSVDLADLKKKADLHSASLGALMITYPSTHGVFETNVREIVDYIHAKGGQVYMDGANMNAQVGVCRPGEYGIDVCHMNLHKTFCIPHGGGGPGIGPIAVRKHLAPFLPGHPVGTVGGENSIGPVAAAPWGSASILPISWMYIRMMGADGLKRATKTAILNANYIAKKLRPYFPVLYSGAKELVAHECILDMRELKKKADIEVEDVAKRLMDFGFHAPTVSWPVPGTIMVEPTESEPKSELDRFCDAMIAIHQEAEAIASGKLDREDNPLKNAPHTAWVVTSDEWKHPYSRQQAAFPAPWVRERKFWPAVSRIDNVWGDRNLFCSCDFPQS